MTKVLDLTKRAWTRTKGPITLIGTWIRNGDDRWRPCMVLIRTGDEGSDHLWPCVITMDKAWVWDTRIGDHQQAAETLSGFLDPLRLPPNTSAINGLFNLIHDHLGDLLTIPPYPAEFQQGEVVAEAVITNHTTGKTREVELRDV